MNERISFGFGNLYVSTSDHIAHFYRSDEEWLELAAGFFGAGLQSGDKCVCVLRPGSRERELKQRLSDDGAPVDAALASGQFALFEGRDEPRLMQEELTTALADVPGRYPLLRWAVANPIPLLPPVTTAILSFNLLILLSPFLDQSVYLP